MVELLGLQPSRWAAGRRIAKRKKKSLNFEERNREREYCSSSAGEYSEGAALSGDETDTADRSGKIPPSAHPHPHSTGDSHQLCSDVCHPGSFGTKISTNSAPCHESQVLEESQGVHEDRCIWRTGQPTQSKRKLKYPGLTGYGRCPGQQQLWGAEQFAEHRKMEQNMLRHLNQ